MARTARPATPAPTRQPYVVLNVLAVKGDATFIGTQVADFGYRAAERKAFQAVASWLANPRDGVVDDTPVYIAEAGSKGTRAMPYTAGECAREVQ